MIDEKLLKTEEKVVYALRALYKSYGYLPYKMSKFEEYELYSENKDFLVSDRFITFNDTSGKLLALKPDVTLSIIKNLSFEKGVKQKVCYNENVYRVSSFSNNFKEIMQTGLECIGDIDIYDIYEALYLSAKSLDIISNDFVLEISHLGLLSNLLDSVCDDNVFKDKAISFISKKDTHDLESLCKEYEIEENSMNKLLKFVSIYGDRNKVLKELENLSVDLDGFNALSELSTLLDNTEFSDKIIFDFSVVNDMNYYNGIVFKGFVKGVSEGILSGGQYDKLLNKMHKKGSAIGFAVYLDLLSALKENLKSYDVDILLIYEEKCSKQRLAEVVNELVFDGINVTAQKSIPDKLRYKKLVKLDAEGVIC